MDCPICLNAITKETGLVTTSCGHSYHFSCISSWYAKGKTCPCCRAAPTSTEVVPDEEEEPEVEFTRAALNAWLISRGGHGAVAESVCSELAAFTYMELNFLSLGNGGRSVTGSEWRWLLAGAETSHTEVTLDVLNPEE